MLVFGRAGQRCSFPMAHRSWLCCPEVNACIDLGALISDMLHKVIEYIVINLRNPVSVTTTESPLSALVWLLTGDIMFSLHDNSNVIKTKSMDHLITMKLSFNIICSKYECKEEESVSL